MHSKFLPEDFQKGSITLIAGKGRYPSLLAEQIRAHKLPINLISLIDQTDANLINTFDSKQHVAVPVGQLKQLLKAIKNWESPYVVLAGQIKPVKLFKGLNPDLKVITSTSLKVSKRPGSISRSRLTSFFIILLPNYPLY
jgi:DUF1009 family protein